MTSENYHNEDKKDSVAKLFENARNQLKRIEERKQTDVRVVIEELAQDLENEGFPTDMICEEMSLQLRGYCSSRYIRECLEEKYKNKRKVKNNVMEDCGTVPQSSEIESEPVKISLRNDGKPVNYDEEIKLVYNDPERNGNGHDIQPNDTVLRWMDLARDKDLEIGQLKEQLTEQKQQIQELIKSVNAMADTNKKDNKSSAVTETLEYKTLKTENSIQEQRITELEQIVKESMKTNPTIGFQTATNLVEQPMISNDITTITTTIPDKVEFPSELFTKFFIATRNVKKSLFLKVKDNKVDGWEESK
jgi:hypothetical protein